MVSVSLKGNESTVDSIVNRKAIREDDVVIVDPMLIDWSEDRPMTGGGCLDKREE
jgi:hypothetical protein